MFTTAFGGGITSARIGNFVTENGNAMERSFLKVASGRTISTPSHGVGDYFRSAEYSRQGKKYDTVVRAITEAESLLDYAERSNQMIWDDLVQMEGLAKDYYADGATLEEQEVLKIEFEELKVKLTETQENAQYNGKNVLADSSVSPLVSVNTNPFNVDQRYEISFDSGKIVDVSAFDITAGKDVVLDGIAQEVDRSASYGAQLTGYRYGLHAQKKVSEASEESSRDRLETIQSVDVAAELFTLTKRSVQQQAAQAMFAQNAMNQGSMLLLVQ